MASVQFLTTPLPFPTIPVYVEPPEQRPGVQRYWFVVVIVLHVAFFGLFMGLLIYYICFVKTPGKLLTEERIREDGLSEWDESSSDSDYSDDSDDSEEFSDDDDSPGSFDSDDGRGSSDEESPRARENTRR